MNKLNRIIYILIAIFSMQMLHAGLAQLTGNIVNGRGGIEKCDDIKVTLVINSVETASTYTDETGAFTFDISGISPGQSASPSEFKLDQNYPNPFNENTTLPFEISTPSEVKLEIFDLRGHMIRSIIHDHRSSGYYFPRWDGRTSNNQICPQGIYFYVLSVAGKTEIRKMTLMNSSVSSSILQGGISAFAKQAGDQIVELVIEDRDIENRTVAYSYPTLPAYLDAGSIPVHVYAFIKNDLEPIFAMEGEDAYDTLDIYFERPFTLTSDDVDIDWTFTPDSLIAVHYDNITESPAVLKVNEPGESKNNYARAYFNIDVRPVIWPGQLRRAYIGVPYSRTILFENNQGDVQPTLQSTLPAPFSFSENVIQGTAVSRSETMLKFDLEDDREIAVSDSALFLVNDYDSVTFNDYVLDVLKEYHRDGRYPYSWVSGYHGVSRNLYYKGTRIAKANADSSHSTYCSGVTFEVYFRSMSRLNQDLGFGEDINGMSASNFSSFISIWFVQSLNGDGPGLALEAYGLGEKIEKMKDVQKGDFVQIWRTSGSGHSVIFINWTTNASGDTTGMRYWSTQTSTNGVNYNTEYFDGLGGNIDKAITYYSRAFKPEDFIDF
ncbi:MAG: T9SS type A sorting domain-containing protein [Candidatus Marinimicrobia bacterium]|nr:T9SS type A sorting domain-containing protein [Candidatus Neomarinimicrobiota bacterium]